MRIAKIVGNVVLSQCHPALRGATLRLAAPLSLDELKQNADPSAEAVVAWDELGAGFDALVALSDGAEAAQPFEPELKPVDAYCAAILDQINLPQK